MEWINFTHGILLVNMLVNILGIPLQIYNDFVGKPAFLSPRCFSYLKGTVGLERTASQLSLTPQNIQNGSL